MGKCRNLFVLFGNSSNHVPLRLDLATMERRLSTRFYKKLAEFVYDMNKMFDNCRLYNDSRTPYYACAESLEGFFISKLKSFRETMKRRAGLT